MTDNIKIFLEEKQRITFDFVQNHPLEYDELCNKLKQMRDVMTLEELEELKKYVSPREAHYQIKPRIEKLKSNLNEPKEE